MLYKYEVTGNVEFLVDSILALYYAKGHLAKCILQAPSRIPVQTITSFKWRRDFFAITFFSFLHAVTFRFFIFFELTTIFAIQKRIIFSSFLGFMSKEKKDEVKSSQ